MKYIHSIPDVQKLAEQFFSPLESAELAALPLHQKLGAFFSCWTHKEAYLKARGDGLAYPFDKFSVSVAPGEPAKLLKVKDGPQDLSRWSLQTLTPAPGFVSALAMEDHTWRLERWQV